MDTLNWRNDFEKVTNHANKLLPIIEMAKMIKWGSKLVIGTITNVIFFSRCDQNLQF